MANGGAIAGGALGGAGTGAAVGTTFGPVGTVVGAVGGAIIGGLSGLFSSNAEEAKAKQQALMRAADQRAAPWLAKLGQKVELTPYTQAKDHSGDVLEGALNGFSQYQAGQKTAQDNQMRQAMMQKLMGNNPQAAAAQTAALQGYQMPTANGAGGANSSSINDAMLMKLMQAQGAA